MASGFRRPGAVRPSAFGIAFEVDRGAGDADESFRPPPPPRSGAQLPAAAHRREILWAVENHRTVLLVGETGSGKSTQVPQYLLEAGWASRGSQIACTQPRRVAAMSVAARVAEERGSALGGEVGYSIRFEDVGDPIRTKIRFLTDGVLLREMAEDPLLSRYSVVLVDEAHERALTTDLVLGLLRKIQRRRPNLRLVVASATLQAAEMAAFFEGSFEHVSASEQQPGPRPHPALVCVQGRSFSTEVFYLTQPAQDYVQAAVEAAWSLHSASGRPGDILIFLTGQEECRRAVQLLQEEEERARKRRRGPGKAGPALRLEALPLYAGLSGAEQARALSFAPAGTRRAIAATNVAETSVTLPGVTAVVDCMFAKHRLFSPRTGLEVLQVGPISRASARQRAGRAGRLGPGLVLRLCTEEAFAQLPAHTLPEAQRADLTQALLWLKGLGVHDLASFAWPAPPPSQALVRGLEALHALGALDDDASLTRPIGHQLSALPLDPGLGRAVLEGCRLGCAQEVLTVAALLSVQSVWGAGGPHELDAAKARFAVAEGDLLTYLNVWRAWQEAHCSARWAAQCRLSQRALLRAGDVRSQLGALCRGLGLDPGSSALVGGARDLTPVRRALASGLFARAAQAVERAVPAGRMVSSTMGLEERQQYRLVRAAGAGEVRLRLHPSSVLFRCRPRWLLFFAAELHDSGWYDMRDVMTVEPEWLLELAPHMYRAVGRR